MHDSLPRGAPVEHGEPRARPRKRIYCGAGIRLVPLDAKAHAHDLFAASHGQAQREALWTYMHYGPFGDEAAMQGWLSAQAEAESALFLSVIDDSSGRAVGLVSFLNMVPAMGTLELGHIWYGPEQQRSQTNTAVIQLMLSEAFDVAGYRRVEWKCDSLNERSRRAALRLGFRYEGLFRQHMIIKARNRDTAWFSMLDSEWPQVKAGMQRWLAWQGPDRPSLADLIH